MPATIRTRIRTALALGAANVARVVSYKVRLQLGVHPVQRVVRPPIVDGPYFRPPQASVALPAPSGWRDGALYYGWKHVAVTNPPDWFFDPFLNRRHAGAGTPWWLLPDFGTDGADIKNVWELSRLDWVVQGAQRALTGDGDATAMLNAWLASWCSSNRAYEGPNWKCGQEASIRVMHLALAALLLGQTAKPEPALIDLVERHLARIAPTIAYAMGQNNNHGTSEAAALLIGGSWLERHGVPAAAAWHRAGRALLTDRASHLIAADGSFSQYSVTYHRFMLDTLSLVAVWIRHHALAPVDQVVHDRAARATEWLATMMDPGSGDAPNLGANDGVNLLPLTDADYRDFRPAVALAAALFDPAVLPAQTTDTLAQCAWLGVDARPDAAMPSERPSRLFDDGGYAVVHRGTSSAILRYPRFRFRPSHADALHVDLWHNGENLLRDGGTFSYAADTATQLDFVGALGHNGVQFDSREQMPRLGRFLWGDWLRADDVEVPVVTAEGVETSAGYRDGAGARHRRRVILGDAALVVRDEVGGFRSCAVLRWRLRPGNWTRAGTTVSDGAHTLAVAADVPIVRCELVAGWESRYYMQKSPITILEVEVATPGTLHSEFRWAA